MFKNTSIVAACILFVCCAISCCNSEVDSISCKLGAQEKNCLNTAQLTFTGTDFKHITDETITLSDDPLIKLTNVNGDEKQLTGVLSFDPTKVPDGPYKINPHLNKDDPSAWAGGILLGEINLGFSPSKQNYKKWIPPTDAWVNGQSSNIIYTNMSFTIYGKFNKDIAYSVFMYTELNTKNQVPTCNNVKATDTALTCTFGVINDQDWPWQFLVREVESTKYLSMKVMLPKLISKPAPTTPEPEVHTFPVVNNANGSCVLHSDACVDGARITLNGLMFTADAPDNYLVDVEEIDDGFCDVISTTSSSLSCNLQEINGVNGSYTLTVRVRKADGEFSADKSIAGTLVLGAGKDVMGWSVNYVKTSYNKKNVEQSRSSTVTTVLTIVFAIFFAITVIVMLIICLRYKLITRTVWCTIKKQLQETQVEELRPRAAVHVKGEPAN